MVNKLLKQKILKKQLLRRKRLARNRKKKVASRRRRSSRRLSRSRGSSRRSHRRKRSHIRKRRRSRNQIRRRRRSRRRSRNQIRSRRRSKKIVLQEQTGGVESKWWIVSTSSNFFNNATEKMEYIFKERADAHKWGVAPAVIAIPNTQKISTTFKINWRGERVAGVWSRFLQGKDGSSTRYMFIVREVKPSPQLDKYYLYVVKNPIDKSGLLRSREIIPRRSISFSSEIKGSGYHDHSIFITRRYDLSKLEDIKFDAGTMNLTLNFSPGADEMNPRTVENNNYTFSFGEGDTVSRLDFLTELKNSLGLIQEEAAAQFAAEPLWASDERIKRLKNAWENILTTEDIAIRHNLISTFVDSIMNVVELASEITAATQRLVELVRAQLMRAIVVGDPAALRVAVDAANGESRATRRALASEITAATQRLAVLRSAHVGEKAEKVDDDPARVEQSREKSSHAQFAAEETVDVDDVWRRTGLRDLLKWSYDANDDGEVEVERERVVVPAEAAQRRAEGGVDGARAAATKESDDFIEFKKCYDRPSCRWKGGDDDGDDDEEEQGGSSGGAAKTKTGGRGDDETKEVYGALLKHFKEKKKSFNDFYVQEMVLFIHLLKYFKFKDTDIAKIIYKFIEHKEKFNKLKEDGNPFTETYVNAVSKSLEEKYIPHFDLQPDILDLIKPMMSIIGVLGAFGCTTLGLQNPNNVIQVILLVGFINKYLYTFDLEIDFYVILCIELIDAFSKEMGQRWRDEINYNIAIYDPYNWLKERAGSKKAHWEKTYTSVSYKHQRSQEQRTVSYEYLNFLWDVMHDNVRTSDERGGADLMFNLDVDLPANRHRERLKNTGTEEKPAYTVYVDSRQTLPPTYQRFEYVKTLIDDKKRITNPLPDEDEDIAPHRDITSQFILEEFMRLGEESLLPTRLEGESDEDYPASDDGTGHIFQVSNKLEAAAAAAAASASTGDAVAVAAAEAAAAAAHTANPSDADFVYDPLRRRFASRNKITLSLKNLFITAINKLIIILRNQDPLNPLFIRYAQLNQKIQKAIPLREGVELPSEDPPSFDEES